MLQHAFVISLYHCGVWYSQVNIKEFLCGGGLLFFRTAVEFNTILAVFQLLQWWPVILTVFLDVIASTKPFTASNHARGGGRGVGILGDLKTKHHIVLQLLLKWLSVDKFLLFFFYKIRFKNEFAIFYEDLKLNLLLCMYKAVKHSTS